METYQLDKICRCCLQSNGQMKPLYGFSLDEMLRSLVGIKVEPNDGLPELICFQCVLQLSRAFRFKTQCQKSNTTILEHIKNALTDGHGAEFESCCDENDNEVSNIEDDKSFEMTSNKQEGHSSVENLLRDQTTATSEIDIIKCKICNKVFNSRKQRVRHVKIHDNNKAHKCLECNKTFSQSCNLKNHKLKHIGGLNTALLRNNMCSVCGKTFKYASSLSKHTKLHTGKNLLYCPSCPKFFLENTTLKNHMRSHTGDRSFICPSCNKSFTNSSNLKKHVRSHSNKKPFECNICGRKFRERNYLTIHRRIHNKEQNVLCSQCGKGLANAKSLHAHMRLHDNSCEFENCDKSFSQIDKLAIRRRNHTGQKFSNSFKNSNYSRDHSNYEEPIACNQYASTFSSKTNLKSQLNKQICIGSVTDHVDQENQCSMHSELNQAWTLAALVSI
ncbi:zinc finger protein OZF-like [Episyrphus balteatus]|uniref:zinc finger protein OZF-like n=1 Tax=Episyrphus balteatus TaxID=286459 RepID=UPI0024862257|nr:zinc finger protein OZF-like [Episyrphus balteatus]